MGCALIASTALALVNCTDPAPPATFTVKFDTNGGKPAIKDKTVETGKLLTKPASEPSKEGYTFEGWYKDKALTQVFNFNADKITANTTLYAKWVTTTYTVTFTLNGGTPNEEAKTVVHGERVQQPQPDPTKTDFTFAGWYKDRALTQAFNFSSDKITANTTLYAKWVPEGTTVTYTVTFDTNGGEPAIADKTIEAGKTLEKPSPNPTKTDSLFAGWYTDQALTQALGFDIGPITANITLYAKWVPITYYTVTFYTVTFNSNEGSKTAPQTVESGKKASRPADPTKEGHTFENWYSDKALASVFDFNTGTITQDTTLYAKWKSGLIDIPDANFRSKLKKLIPDAFVGEKLDVTSDEVTGRRQLDVSTSDSNTDSIKNLTGIQYFTMLVELNCRGNLLADLDVSKNTKLGGLNCTSNSLTTLDVSKNTQLTALYCANNSLTKLDLSANIQLKTLSCGSNSLAKLDVSKNTKLTALYCSGNRLTTLDLSNNTALTFLNCQKNLLTHLDMRGMRSVGLGLSIHATTGETNVIKTLKVHENLKDHAQISAVKTDRGNEVTIATYSAAERSTAYTLVCGNYNPNTDACLVEIPDAAFRTKLKASIPDAFEGEKLNPTSDKVTGLKTLNVVSSSIKDLTGIQYFTALTELICDNNMLTSLDISKNKKVKKLNCSENQLTSLDVSKNTALTELICHNNSLASLDVSKNTALITLHSYDNRLTSLDLSKNRALTSFSCSKNQLTSLDIRGMRSVVILGIQADTDETNAINTLKVHENLKAHAQIKALKTARGDKVTIETYSASGTSYTLVCSDYDPTETDEQDRCKDAP